MRRYRLGTATHYIHLTPCPHPPAPTHPARAQAGRPILHEAVWRDNLPGLRLLLCTEDIELDELDEVGAKVKGGRVHASCTGTNAWQTAAHCGGASTARTGECR